DRPVPARPECALGAGGTSFAGGSVMCGIAGIIKLDPGELVDEARLQRMRGVLRHRGPDGEGLWLDGPVGLGHRRLSIVDVAAGHQPMANEDGSGWVTSNARVHNTPHA